MATGDLNNNIEKTRNELTSVRYDGAWNGEGISEGSPEAFLPLVHFVFVDFSRFFARFLASKGFELVGKNDMRFMEEVYRILRNEFNYRPSLNLAQFFTVGFAERKLIFVCDLIKLCKRKHNEINKQHMEAKKKAVSAPSPSLMRGPSPKREQEPIDNSASSLRKSGGNLAKSTNSNGDSTRRRSGSTGSSSGASTRPHTDAPKKIIVSASLLKNDIDVVEFKTNGNSARPPIRVIKNESLPPKSDKPPSHPSYTNSPSPPPPFPSHNPSLPPSSYPIPSPSSPPKSDKFPHPTYTHPPSPPPSYPSHNPSSYPPHNPPSGNSPPKMNGYMNGYMNGKTRFSDVEIEDIETEESTPVPRRPISRTVVNNTGIERTVHAFASSHPPIFRADDVLEEEEEEDENHDVNTSHDDVTARSSSRNGVAEGRDESAPSSNDSMGYLIAKLSQMESRVMQSIDSLQSSMVSLETRVRNLENVISDPSFTNRRVVYQSSHQPTPHSNPTTDPYKLPNGTSHPTHRLQTNYTTPSRTIDTTPHQTNYPLPHHDSSLHTNHAPNAGKPTGNYMNGAANNYANGTATNHYGNGHTNPHETSTSSDGSNDSNPEKYKPTQSTQDFISSITKRFKDTRDLLQQTNQQLTQGAK